MIYHVLPGDAQVEDFRRTGLDGQMLVCRESFIEGDLSGDTFDEFSNNRAAFHGADPASYKTDVASQFQTLLNIGASDEVNLWFEYDLFCAVNMWFCLNLLQDCGADVYRVSPVHLSFEDRWDGFGNANAEILQRCYDNRVKLTKPDIDLGNELWDAFRLRDADKLLRLTSEPNSAFQYLGEAGHAAAEIDTMPAAIIAEINHEGKTDLKEVFPEFRQRAGVYGFGDSQVKRLMNV